MTFKNDRRNWVEFRLLPDLVERDFHWSSDKPSGDYYDNMQAVWNTALSDLIVAQRDGKKFVLFRHGWSTSGIGKTTARSQVRKLMRSKDATPYVIRRECIQHDSVFVAAIRPCHSDEHSLAHCDQLIPETPYG